MKTKVFHIVTHFDLGGAERIAINIAKSPSTDYEYHVVEVVRGSSDYSAFILQELQAHHIKYHRAPIRGNKLSIILFPIWFLYIYLKYSPQIIHTHTEVPDLSVYLFHFLQKLTFRKVKYIRTIHNTVLWTKWNSIGNMVERFFIRQNANIAISHAVQYSYRDRYKVMPPIVFNGVEVAKQKDFQYIIPHKINILFAGRLEYQKGIDELVSVITHFANDPSLFFHIIGSGSLKPKIEILTQYSNVRYYDKIYNLSQYLHSFEYVFMPSNFEGLATLSIESSLSRTPVIINSCKGLDETLPPNWPLKVNNNSVSEYIHIFQNLPQNNEYERCIQIGYDYVKTLFSIEQMQQNYEGVYKSMKNLS